MSILYATGGERNEVNRIMRLIKMAICITMIGILIVGCGGNDSGASDETNLSESLLYEEIPENIFIKMSQIIVKNNEEQLIDLFSDSAKENGLEQESIKVLLSLFPNGFQDYEPGGKDGSEELRNGKVRYDYDQIFHIPGEKGYYILLDGCARDDFDTENVGIKRLVVFPDNFEACPETPEYGVFVFE